MSTKTTGAEWLLATEIEIDDLMRRAHEERHEDEQRAAFEADRIATFCTSGSGHEEIEFTDAEFVPASETNTGVALVRSASAVCLTCETVLS